MQQDAPKNYIRLGFSAINIDKILAGLNILGGLIKQLNQLTPSSIEPLKKRIG